MSMKQFRIGQLAQELEVERFVIRFWEKEFCLKPHRTQGGQRFYTQKDLDTFKKVKALLYDQGFTIAGAKKALQEKFIGSKKTKMLSHEEEVATIKHNLMRLKKQLLILQDLL